MERRRYANTRRRVRIRVRPRFFIIVFLLLFVTGARVFVNSAFFRVTEVTVRGARRLGEEEVVRLAGVRPGMNIWTVRRREAEMRLRRDVRVKEASVRPVLPRRILIEIVERRPVALVPYFDRFVEVDEEGVVLSVEEKLSGVRLPVIGRVEVADARVGSVLEVAGVREALEVLRCFADSCLAELSDISTQDGAVRIYSVDGIEIRLGPPGDRPSQKARVLEALLVELEGRRAAVEYIDLSVPARPAVMFRP